MQLAPQRILDFIATLPGLDTLTTPHAWFWYHDPRRDQPHDKRHPFATLVTTDQDDGHSDLERRGAYRVNVGVPRETYRALFGPEPAWNGNGPVATGHDFTQADTFLPHPVYAPLSWVCIVGPTEASWPRLQEYLRKAHDKTKRMQERREG